MSGWRKRQIEDLEEIFEEDERTYVQVTLAQWKQIANTMAKLESDMMTLRMRLDHMIGDGK